MSILIDRNTPVIVQGITGKMARFHTADMVKYGTNVVGGVVPGKGGMEVEVCQYSILLLKPLKNWCRSKPSICSSTLCC